MRKYLVVILLSISSSIWSRTIPVNNAVDLVAKTPLLQPNDTLLVAGGTYDLDTSWCITGLTGAANGWIVLLTTEHAKIRTNERIIQISNSQYVKITGFEITPLSTFDDNNIGIFITGSASYLTLENLYIHHTGWDAIGIYPIPGGDHITVRNCEIAYAYQCGIYCGYPGRNVVTDALFENNYIHNCPKDSTLATGYGIQLKGWSYRAKILNNVLHDIGGSTRSGICVYYGKTPLAGDAPADVNLVSGNVLWNCRSEGITAMSDAIIENNIVFDADVGLHLQDYTDESFTGRNATENLVMRHNTIFRCVTSCLTISSLTSVGTNVALTGNAAFQPVTSRAAVVGSPATNIYLEGNVYYGTTQFSRGVVAAHGLNDFVGVTSIAKAPNLDFYPSATSALKDVLSKKSVLPGFDIISNTDFNYTARPFNTLYDVGAYELTQAVNPGWKIQQGFKTPLPVSATEKKGSRHSGGMELKIENYPNPFSPASTVAHFRVRRDGPVGQAEKGLMIQIFNLRGQLVTTLPAGASASGGPEVLWNGKDDFNRKVNPGVYYCRLAGMPNGAFEKFTVLE